MRKNGLFVGLMTLDWIYLVENYPTQNQKIVASDYTVAAGGPATNAAVTFQNFGNQSTLMGVLGSHPLSQFIQADLSQQGLEIVDLAPNRLDAPPVSSILVSQGTGDRSVISINATKSQISASANLSKILPNIDIILIDGHQIPISEAIAQEAKTYQIPIVLDGGSWKPGLDIILPFVDYAICSANFHPPDCQTSEDIFAYLQSMTIPYIAITQGDQPIQYCTPINDGSIPVPTIQAVDTLGAGDIFHGAFCHFMFDYPFTEALAKSAKIASQSCLYFGTRQWLNQLKNN